MTAVAQPATEQPTTAVEVATKFAITKEDLQALADKYKDMKVDGIQDKNGLKALVLARKELKRKRIEIEGIGENMRESAKIFSKAVIAREKELISIIQPVEHSLQEEEDRIEIEIEKARQEQERIEADKFQNRMRELGRLNYAMDAWELKEMDDENYARVLANAKELFAKEEEFKAERALIAEEQRIAKEKADAEERERLAKVAAEQDAERTRLEEERQYQELKAAELKAESDRIEKEKRELAEAKQREEDERIQREEQERQRIVELGNNRFKQLKSYGYEYELDDLGTMPESTFNILLEVKRTTYEEQQQQLAIEKANADREERARLEALEAKRQEELRPDKERIENFAAKIGTLEFPDVNSDEAQRLLSWAKIQLDNISSEIFKRLDTL